MTRRTSPTIMSLLMLVFWSIAQTTYAAAGRTPGNFAVAPSGAATYTIPIWSPPGPGGVQPSVSLLYDSHAGNGYVGVGWNLVGLSQIYRCNLTYAQDAAPAPVALVTSDALCIDGKRLRLTAGTQGIAGSTYQTEIADFTNVSAIGTTGNGPAYFRVQAPNGTIYEYGNGGNSQLTISNGTTTAFRWMLDKVTDASGNTMTVSYTANQSAPGTVVPSSIAWTPSGPGSTNYLYNMSFSYTTVSGPGVVYGYLAGAPIISNQILQSIAISYSGSVVKEYFFAYQTSATTGHYELSSVTECADSAESNCLAPTTVAYQSGVPGITSTASTVSGLLANNNSDVISGYDFNGDGIDDLAVWISGSWWVAFGTPSGLGTPFNSQVPDAGTFPFATFGSVDGSGTDGFLVPRSGVWWFYKWNGSAFAGVSTGAAVDSYTTANNPTTAILSDVNGDGLPDLVYQSSNGFVRVMLNTTSGATPTFSVNPINTVSWQNYGISAIWSPRSRPPVSIPGCRTPPAMVLTDCSSIPSRPSRARCNTICIKGLGRYRISCRTLLMATATPQVPPMCRSPKATTQWVVASKRAIRTLLARCMLSTK
jgi:Salmonella virulence plasmid 65kDa B protein